MLSLDADLDLDSLRTGFQVCYNACMKRTEAYDVFVSGNIWRAKGNAAGTLSSDNGARIGHVPIDASF
jgi:hypothetical protein